MLSPLHGGTGGWRRNAAVLMPGGQEKHPMRTIALVLTLWGAGLLIAAMAGCAGPAGGGGGDGGGAASDDGGGPCAGQDEPGGETAVGANLEDRVYLSVDGGEFMIVEDGDAPLAAQRAAGVAASSNLVAFLIPADPSDPSSSRVSVGYATLPPPQ
jgi:hypothetical protein